MRMLVTWVLLAGVAPARAAEAPRYSRLELWGEGALSFDLRKGWEIGLAQHLRITPDPLRLWELYTDVGASKDVEDWLRLGGGVRAGARDFVPGRLEARLRPHVDARVRTKFGEAQLSLRERYQVRLPLPGSTTLHTLRSKVQLSYDVSDRLRLFAAVEPYLLLGKPRPFDRIRLEGGLRVDLPKRLDAEVWYRLDEPIQDTNDPRVHVIGMSLTKTLKPKRKRKSKSKSKSKKRELEDA